MTDYAPPISAFLVLGDQGVDQRDWPDYIGLYGIDATHVPELIRMATDPALHRGREPAVWAPVHAWRALGQLQAKEAIEPLIQLFDLIESDDYCVPEIADVVALIGPESFAPLARHFEDTDRPLYSRTLAIEGIEKVVDRYPALRGDAVSTLTRHLSQFDSQEPIVNGFLIGALIQFEVTEPDVLATIAAAYAAGSVDEEYCGDWEDVQVELGLLPERLTPRRPRLLDYMPSAPSVSSAGQSHASSQANRAKKAKDKARRKLAKQSRKRNRRRR